MSLFSIMSAPGGGDNPWFKKGPKGKSRIIAREPETIGEANRFAKSYTLGLKNDWFSALKNAERIAMDEAFRAADKCPRTVLVQVPFGFHGGVDQVLDGVRVSLCRLKVTVGGEDRFLKPGYEDGDFTITSNACQTLVVVTFVDINVKEAVVKAEKVPFFKKKSPKDTSYTKADKDLRIVDLIKPKITLVITNFIPELNPLYNEALSLFYGSMDVEVTIEDGVKKQYIDMGEGVGYHSDVFDGKKYVKLSFKGDLPNRNAIVDGKVRLDLKGVGLKTVYVRMLGKQYACESCGGYECERFYCINKCVFCRRDLRYGHRQSECEERGWVDSNHNRKARDLERMYRDMYTPAIVQGSSEGERRNVLEEREKLVNGKVENKIEKTIDYRINEAKDKLARDTPYEPLKLTVRNEGSRKGRRGDEREEDIAGALHEGIGGNKKAKGDTGVTVHNMPTQPAHTEDDNMDMEGADGKIKGPFDEPVNLQYWEGESKKLGDIWARGIPVGDDIVQSVTNRDANSGKDYVHMIDKEGNHYLLLDTGGIVAEVQEGGEFGKKWRVDFDLAKLVGQD